MTSPRPGSGSSGARLPRRRLLELGLLAAPAMIALGGRGGTANAGSVAESSAGAGPIDYSGATNSSDATYYNDAAFPAADPYVLHDKPSGYYYAYSTDGARPGADGTPFAFGIYR